MKIVVAPDSFKGSMTAREAADAVEKGVAAVFPEAVVVKVPMADGGEGTAQSLVDATGGIIVEVAVTGPLREPVRAFFGILGAGAPINAASGSAASSGRPDGFGRPFKGETAVIEMASASGLTLVPPDRRNPLITTTRGTGELIRAALDRGCRKFIIGIGGSATNDGGMGMAQALGVRLVDRDGHTLGDGGGELERLERIDVSGLDPRLKECSFAAACDVDNPLCGPRGASAVFGPQKGATLEMVRRLDANLARYAEVLRRDRGVDVADIPGAGAAGGLGAGLVAFLRAELKRGIEIVIDATGLRNHLEGADLVITGEGRMDFQSLGGKTPVGVAGAAAEKGVPVLALVGSIDPGAEAVYQAGISAVAAIVPGPMTLEEAMAGGPELMARAAERAMRIYRMGLESGRPGRW